VTYIYFSTAISRDLLDATRIDGAGEIQVFALIARPLATSFIALVGFVNFTGTWYNYFLPYVTPPGPKSPIQVGLAELLSADILCFRPSQPRAIQSGANTWIRLAKSSLSREPDAASAGKLR
jgi:multiple sugar transport system permease protein